ncbi:hypothetical protein ACFL4X_00505 [Gemmatimonadota bacterium]
MRALYVILLVFITSQAAMAKKTWEKDPTGWSGEECQRVQEMSPWCSESYKPLSGDIHYLIKAQWVSPVILCAEAREEQLESERNLEFLKERYIAKLEKEGIDEDTVIKFRVYPMKGVGMVGQNLHMLYAGDPFFEDLSEKIKLVKNKDRDDYLSPLDIEPLGGSLSEGFQVFFRNEGFISSQTWRAELVIDSDAGEFKFVFEPRKMKPADFELKL